MNVGSVIYHFIVDASNAGVSTPREGLNYRAQQVHNEPQCIGLRMKQLRRYNASYNATSPVHA